MGRRAREESEASVDISALGLARPHKQVKLLRDGLEYAGEDWSWRTFLEKLHFFLEFETAGDALEWLEDGSHFLLHRGLEASLESWLGLRVCSLHQALEVLSFDRQEELHWEYTVYHHASFVQGNPSKITEMVAGKTCLSSDKEMTMPSVAYNAALKPLEVRLSLSEAHSQSWEVTVAPSVLPHPGFDDTEFFHFHQECVGIGSSMEESSWGEMFDDADRLSEHEMNSPLWWSQRSDFSSICTDDLSDMDALSQISAYYGQ